MMFELGPLSACCPLPPLPSTAASVPAPQQRGAPHVHDFFRDGMRRRDASPSLLGHDFRVALGSELELVILGEESQVHPAAERNLRRSDFQQGSAMASFPQTRRTRPARTSSKEAAQYATNAAVCQTGAAAC